ncbi:MAG: M42 family metallopeptidase [Clostridia bacterium]|nr:M42 family metallopeptidase [Clostridia bacterium]
MNWELLRELTQAWGVSGREGAVAEIVRREAAPYADEIATDALHNVIVLKRGAGGGKRIMLAAHMDEIGLQVTKVDGDGKVRVRQVGWVWPAALYNDKVHFRNGIVGVVGCVGPIEDVRRDIGKLFIDIGCTTKEQAEKYVKVGDMCGLIGAYHELPEGRVTAKSLDDRIGCLLLLEALKANDGTLFNDVYYVFSTQEEIGCRGAQAAAQRILPDVGLSIDVTPDHAYPCDLSGSNTVGEGVAVAFGDPGSMPDEDVVDTLIACCEKNGLRYQRDVIDRGGTDAQAINLAGCGVRTGAIAVVTRYPHSQSCLIAKEDAEGALKLIQAFCREKLEFIP